MAVSTQATQDTLVPSANEEWPLILCVDDDPNIAAAMQRNFHRYKVRFRCAYHGMQGIMNAIDERPDLIITDLQMPFASGEELIDCLTRNPATTHTPVVVVTGRASARLTARLRQAGVIAVLNKPLKFDVLIEEISQAIDVEPK